MVYRVVFAISFVIFLLADARQDKNGSQDDSEGCFCKLQGTVDDCACKVETLDSFNNNKVFPRLQSLLGKDYFRYFKVNLKKECPFWSDDSRCALKDCHVKKCTEDQVPLGLKSKTSPGNKYSKEAQKADSCDEERELSALNTTVSDEKKEAFKDWGKYDDSQDLFCDIDDENTVDMSYVDLLLNPERYTGYKGESPQRIWKSIYEENCFKPEEDFKYGPKGQVTSLCLEKRAFYRMISGLHTSINLHLSAKYLMPAKNGYGAGTWGPNVEEFLTRFDPERTSGAGPQRLKNLYFTYLVELRALAKAAPYLQQEDFYTGNDGEDEDVKQGVSDLLDIIRSFPDHFDESKLFRGKQKEAQQLKEAFKNHFRNISRIMDCVGCDKCKLWGKLQVQGMGTALKILFSGASMGPESTVNAKSKKHFQLTRSEIVSLFNAFGRLSSSVNSLEMFRALVRK